MILRNPLRAPLGAVMTGPLGAAQGTPAQPPAPQPTQPPQIVTAPAIAGVGYAGQTLTATAGVWSGADTVARQWFADGAPVGRATSLTYTVAPELDGKEFAFREIGANAAGSGTAWSNAIHHWVPADGPLFAMVDLADPSAVTVSNGRVAAVEARNAAGGVVDTLSQATAANRPAFNATVAGGLPAMVFNTGANPNGSVSNWLRGTSLTAFNRFHQATGGALYLVFRAPEGQGVGGANAQSVVGNAISTAEIGHFVRVYDTDALNLGIRRGVTGTSAAAFDALLNFNSFRIVQVNFDADAPAADRLTARVGGGALQTGNTQTDAPSAANASNPLTIGSSPFSPGTRNFDGTIAAIIYTTSGADREKFEGWARWKYGVPLDPPGHPYSNSPPEVSP